MFITSTLVLFFSCIIFLRFVRVIHEDKQKDHHHRKCNDNALNYMTNDSQVDRTWKDASLLHSCTK